MATSYEPILDWSPYFDSKRTVVVPGENTEDHDSTISFVVFESHGLKGAPLFILHHGAGHAALSMACLARELKKLLGDNVNLLAYDCRGHGDTTVGKNVKALDCHPSTLAKDMGDLLEAMYPIKQELPCKVFLIGHSMGGTASIEAAYLQTVPHLAGIVILDCAQKNSTIPIEIILKAVNRRPSSFENLQEAVEFGYQSGDSKNLDSIRVSYPYMVKPAPFTTPETSSRQVFKTDMAEIIRLFWDVWFIDMTTKFLAPPAAIPKMLVLAGNDRMLDAQHKAALAEKKFTLLVMPNSGHSVQEDEPQLLAREIVAFWKKYALREV
ncbi:Protein phosphatase methylesterase 1 [Podila humilis]|nr:Protein phosphatase methylesterase 1 [Podila humilis]